MRQSVHPDRWGCNTDLANLRRSHHDCMRDVLADTKMGKARLQFTRDVEELTGPVVL